MSEAGKSGLPVNQIIQGDCLEVMRGWPSGCIDLLHTDPPYGLFFMGKDWDKAVPSVEIWRECLRVLKDGAFAFIMCIPRQDCLARMIVNLQAAGFNTAFTSLYWAYATGFPKAENISKAVDKNLGFERQIVGIKTTKNDVSIRGGHFHSKEEKEMSNLPITIPNSPGAKALDGSYGGFQPKPAVEVIIVAMKPLSEKTYVDQALTNRKGITWLDDGRIPFQNKDEISPFKPSDNFPHPQDHVSKGNGSLGSYRMERGTWYPSEGRFPANLLVSDGVLDNGVITNSTGGKSGHTSAYGGGYKEEYYGGVTPGLGDSGSFSRYFDLDAWWDKKAKELSGHVRKTFPFLIVPKASKSERNEGLDDMIKGEPPASARSKPAIGRKKALGESRSNFHPTVKPLKLMSYLVTLGSREGDVVLDPFIGSGTTAIACEILNRRWLGIEINPEYCEIARKRVEPWLNQSRLGKVDVFE